MKKSMKFNVYGRLVSVQKTEQGWKVFFLGNDGKKRPANDIIIPSIIGQEEIEDYLSDLCHEWATDNYRDVYMIS